MSYVEDTYCKCVDACSPCECGCGSCIDHTESQRNEENYWLAKFGLNKPDAKLQPLSSYENVTLNDAGEPLRPEQKAWRECKLYPEHGDEKGCMHCDLWDVDVEIEEGRLV